MLCGSVALTGDMLLCGHEPTDPGAAHPSWGNISLIAPFPSALLDLEKITYLIVCWM